MFSTAATSPADVPLPVKRRMLAGFGSYRQAVARRHPARALPNPRTIPDLELACCNCTPSLPCVGRKQFTGRTAKVRSVPYHGAQRTIHHNDPPFIRLADTDGGVCYLPTTTQTPRHQ